VSGVPPRSYVSMWCRFRVSWHCGSPPRGWRRSLFCGVPPGSYPGEYETFRVRKRVGTVSVRSQHRIGGSAPLAWGFALRALAGGPGPGPPPLAWRRTFRTRGRGAVLTLIRRRLAFCFAGLLHLRGDVCVKFLATRGACASSRSPTSVATRFREIPGPRRGRNQALPLFFDPATVFSVAVPRPHGLRCVALAFGRGLWSPPSAASVFSIGF
jgi:hypothetical protein